jgi:hypothetical protein
LVWFGLWTKSLIRFGSGKKKIGLSKVTICITGIR